jgi:hypothetical protein
LSLKIDVLLVPSNQPVGGRKNGLVHRPTGGLKRALCACASIAAILSALLPGSAFGATSLLGAGAPPAISSVSPVSGPASGGTPVTIIGTDFTGATAVTFGSADAVGFTVDSTTQITAISPAGSGTVVLAITTPDGTSSTSGFDSFSYTPAPAVSSVSPASGPESGGTSVAITGNDLAGATDVDFGATAAAAFTVDSATQITATSPAGSGTVHVTVTTPGGTSAAGSDDSFAYFGQPAVSAVAPNAGPTAGGTSVIITGTNFGGASAVSFGLAAATSFTIDSSTQITATSPAGTGTVDVRVVTPGGTSATSGADNFSYLVAPTVTGVTPSTGPAAGGTAVTITGTDLTGATDVSFGGSAAIFTVDSSTQISATSPAGSGTVDITVTTAGGTSATSPDDQFIFTPPPTVTSVSPNSGSAVGGTSVTITGTGFAGATAVSFGASAATTFTVDDSTHITATSPAGSGTVDVIVTTSDGTSVTAGADHFSYVGTPTVTGVDPNAGPLAGGTSVIITGTGLSGASAVDFGSTAATSFIVDSATQITATSPAGSAGPVDVTVTTLGGTSGTSASDNFTYVAAPTVSSVTPSAGPTGGGTSVTITGTDLTGATAVSFGASAATTFTVDSATQITATSPAGSIGSVDVTLTAVGGTSSTSSADQFSYVAAPTVTGVSPSGGPDAGGTSVTITGTDFTDATGVSFGSSPASTFNVDSATQITATSPSGSGTVQVTVTTDGGTSVTSSADQFTYSDICTSASVDAGGASSAVIGAVVHLVAGSTGCPVPTYEFWLQRPTGKWSVAQPFGGNIWDWNTTGYAAGVYTIHVWANQSGHSTRTWEAFGELIFRLNSMAGSCTTAGLLPISGSPEQLAGADVAFTATSGGCTSPMYEYWVGSTNGTWTLTRSFSSAPSWTWHTTGKAPGVYEIHVWANQTGHSKSVWEAFASSTVTLTGCTSATLDPTTASAAAGESIAMTAHSGGCPNPQYEFWVGYPNGTWHLIQGFGSASFNWSTHGLAPGEYEVHVWANQQGASTSTFEAFGSSTVTLTGCTSVTLSPASGSTPRGGSVTFTAMNPLGCPHPVYELWTLGPSHVWRLLIPFSSASSWTLPIPRNGTPGTYTLHVWANNANSSYKAYEAVGSATRKIT